MKDDAVPSPLSLQVLLPATKEALASLYATKQRTLLALLGIVIGISSVIAMITVGKIVEAEALKQFQELGTDFVTVEKAFGAPSSRGAMANRGLPLAVALRMAQEMPEVSRSAPMAIGSGKIAFGGQTWDSNLVGAMQDFAPVNRLSVAAGRFVSDLDQHAYFCVIGDETAQKMAQAGTASPVGSRIKLNGLLFTVIGVLPRMPEGGMRPFDPNRSIIIPLSTALRIIDHASVDRVLVRLHPAANPREAPARITGYFKQRAPEFEIAVRTAEELIAQMEKQMRIFTLMLGAIGSISLIVGGVGVMNVMLVSVTERKNEIGVRRAFGAQRTDIQMQFLVEALMLCALGGVLGAGGGAGSAYIIAKYSHWTFFMPKIALVLGVLVSCAIGLFFGFYPAFQASRLKIIQALRNE